MATKKPDPVADVAVPTAAEARAELQRGLRLFKAFEHADIVLAALENLEQVAAERKSAAKAAETSATKIMRDAQAEAARLMAEATARLDEAAAMKRQSDGELHAARQTAAEIKGAAEAEADGLQRRISAMRSELSGLEKAVAVAQDEANKAEARVQAIKDAAIKALSK